MPTDHIRLIGAFDRYNYGDLLLPLVTERALRRAGFDGRIEAVSTRSLDLRARGVPEAIPTASFARTRRARGAALHLIPGGEVLNANWIDTMASLLSPRAAWWLKASAQLPLLRAVLEHAIGRGLSAPRGEGSLLLPWVHDPARWGRHIETAYFAVGGPPGRLRARSQALVRENLMAASFRCVRDRVTLEDVGGETWLAPDLVSDAPSLLTENELEPHLRRLRDRFPKGWLTFQINRRQSRDHLVEIAQAVTQLAAQLDCAVVLLPLGRAARHEDQTALEALEQRLRPEIRDLLLIHERSLFLAVAVISGAKIFLGSSLHGTLTAMAYHVPWVAIGKVDKLARFLETWCEDERAPVPCLGILTAAARALEESEQERIALGSRLSSSTRSAFGALCEGLW